MRSILQQRFDVRCEGLNTGLTHFGSAIFHTVAVETDRPFDLGLLRLREIETTIKSRHGFIVPDPEDTDDRPWCLDYGRAVQCSVTPQDLHQWARRWMPWAMTSELDQIIGQEGWRRYMIGADAIADMLMVSAVERQALELRTIGAYDVPKEVRLAAAKIAKQERDRERQSARRRAEGRVDRQAYLESSLSARKPWEALGISRRTYERRRQRDASVSPLSVSITNGDGLATSVEAVEEQVRNVA
ncbi:hypothetical protein [Devosia sp. RR2S18]|uniref:hypothetical protein n=1 Tax=Devosia rhizosphaerae TaxID=3049774 RepID=UPI00253FF2B1|nr:hypothetical protein [Devosia sp. RR2S18]WIJ26614.1 hypothetical protein QOV41_07640 [Devosia sp. RR2S18]